MLLALEHLPTLLLIFQKGAHQSILIPVPDGPRQCWEDENGQYRYDEVHHDEDIHVNASLDNNSGSVAEQLRGTRSNVGGGEADVHDSVGPHLVGLQHHSLDGFIS